MVTWFLENLWALWLLVAIIFAIIEILSLDFFFLMLATAALATILAAPLTTSLPIQVLVFATLSLLLLFLVRPKLINRLHSKSSQEPMNIDALIGRQAEVLQEITPSAGLIHLAGDTWTARTEIVGLTIPLGAQVVVQKISGATAYVEPIHPGYQN